MGLMRAVRLGACFSLLAAVAVDSHAGLPVTGVPVSELSMFDDAMQTFMQANGITAGVLAVSRDGCVIYHRGFGWSFYSAPLRPLPEIAPFRLASLEKPFTSAAVRKLVDDGALGPDGLNRFVFDLGPSGLPRVPPGLLSITPWLGVADVRLANVRVIHLLQHLGGWDRGGAIDPWSGDPGFDPMLRSSQIGDAMGLSQPPTREQIASFMLSMPLQFDPGGPFCSWSNPPPSPCWSPVDSYSNFGYMLLGLIVEQQSGMSHQQYLRHAIVTPDLWVPGTEVIRGRSHRADQSPREPLYSSADTCEDVYPPNNDVPCPYGGFDLESMVGHGNLVSSAGPVIALANNFVIAVGGDSGVPLLGGTVNGGHLGRLNGCDTAITQRIDGVNIVVLFNKAGASPLSCPNHLACSMSATIASLIDAGGFVWPTLCVEGFWVDFGQPASGTGGYDDPFAALSTALAQTTDGTRLRFKPGASAWTGTVSERMRWDAPFGAVRIGE